LFVLKENHDVSVAVSPVREKESGDRDLVHRAGTTKRNMIEHPLNGSFHMPSSPL